MSVTSRWYFQSWLPERNFKTLKHRAIHIKKYIYIYDYKENPFKITFEPGKQNKKCNAIISTLMLSKFENFKHSTSKIFSHIDEHTNNLNILFQMDLILIYLVIL